MKTVKRIVAATELLLVFPALLFMSALIIRNQQPVRYEPARSAQRIVTWYAERQWTLWVLLIALPLAVLVGGCATLLWRWQDEVELREVTRQTLSAIGRHLSTLLIAAATVVAGGILSIVAVHVLRD
jgi:ABC-type Fe3+ transport system permease subunit